MSYILDALRRADSERERGGVPGIHAQPVPRHWRESTRGRRMKPWVGALIGLSVVVLGAFAWHLAGRDAPPEVAPSPAPATPSPATPSPAIAAQSPAPVAPTPTPLTPVAPTPAPPTPAAPTLPATAAQDRPAAPAAAVTASPVPAAKPAERPRPPASPAPEPARRKAAPPVTVAEMPATPVAPAGAASGAQTRVYAQGDLPQEVRRELPALVIGGSMYSQTPSSRMLIVNGQLLHEGDTIAPGLSLEQIKLKSAILRFKGYRYEINY